MSNDACAEVAQYLERFGASRSRPDVDRISDHVKTCSGCYQKMSEFFRVMEVPENEYLDETLNDLTLALYNLVKSLMAHSAEAEAKRENVRFVVEPGATSDYVQEGHEMIDDVQDFAGTDQVRGASMEGIRDLVDQSQDQFDFAVSLLEKSAGLDGESSLDCLNLKGILFMERNDLGPAEEAFKAVIASARGDLHTRKAQVHAMNNLSFACAANSRFDEAVRWAKRSRGLAEETDLDPFSARFGLVYFLLSRREAGDLDLAREEVNALCATDRTRTDFLSGLDLDSNLEIRKVVEAAGLRPKPLP